ncbi:hypothetical protein BJ742DRAFT_793557, partial [Cladochytrium replicatum]
MISRMPADICSLCGPSVLSTTVSGPLTTNLSELYMHQHSQTVNPVSDLTGSYHNRVLSLREQVRILEPYKSEADSLRAELLSLQSRFDEFSSKLSERTKEVDELRGKVVDLNEAAKEHAKVAKELAIRNTRLEHDMARMKEEMVAYEMNVNILKHKVSLLVQNGEMKQKMIKDFEQQISGRYSLSVDNRSLAALREFQATRLRELFERSKRHLELERKQNDFLRKNLEDSSNANLVTGLRNEVAVLKEELQEAKQENTTLRTLQYRQEKLLRLTERRLEEFTKESDPY